MSFLSAPMFGQVGAMEDNKMKKKIQYARVVSDVTGSLTRSALNSLAKGFPLNFILAKARNIHFSIIHN